MVWWMITREIIPSTMPRMVPKKRTPLPQLNKKVETFRDSAGVFSTSGICLICFCSAGIMAISVAFTTTLSGSGLSPTSLGQLGVHSHLLFSIPVPCVTNLTVYAHRAVARCCRLHPVRLLGWSWCERYTLKRTRSISDLTRLVGIENAQADQPATNSAEATQTMAAEAIAGCRRKPNTVSVIRNSSLENMMVYTYR